MVEFSLRFKVPDNLSKKDAQRIFYWPPGGHGSFLTDLTPRLAALGPVAALNADFARLAVLVYAADRSVRRAKGSVNWTSRDLTIAVPVSDASAWTGVLGRITFALGFLSGDNWTVKFTQEPIPKESAAKNLYPSAEKVVLLSGGADSAAGALRARSEAGDHVLVSHFGGNGIGAGQRHIASEIQRLLPAGSAQQHLQVGFRRRRAQPNGLMFENENSTRTRSLLFLALGLAVASINKVSLWIPENGFASLNPPMGADQFGSISTKTTHPWFLHELEQILTTVGAQGAITNPFAAMTKGEIFSWVGETLGESDASAFLSATESCGFTNKRFWAVERSHHCGTCFGCLLRRASFAAAGIADTSTYAVDNPPSQRAAQVLEMNSLLPSIRAHVARGIRVTDIAAMRLPPGYSPSAALDLCTRGAAELSNLA